MFIKSIQFRGATVECIAVNRKTNNKSMGCVCIRQQRSLNRSFSRRHYEFLRNLLSLTFKLHWEILFGLVESLTH